MSPSGEHSESPASRITPKPIAKWVPIAAFAGTTVALAVPLVYLARQRNAALRSALKESSMAPPRRGGGSSAQLSRGPTATPSAETSTTKVEYTSPGTGELLSALSRVDFSTAIFAGKAFGIATCLVTVGAVTLTWGIKTTMGVQDTQEFAQRMRSTIWKRLPGLTAQIHRPPEVDDEGFPIVEARGEELEWSWEDAEKRLQAAYDKGGFPAWAQTAMREMEAELKVERARRQKELERSDGEGAAAIS